MQKQWFCFSAPGIEDQYGHGDTREAQEYARELAPEFSWQPLGHTVHVEPTGLGLEISEALAVLRGGHDV
ncbi:MAG: hypothetical protein WDN46_22920 [Methylocella sp.]